MGQLIATRCGTNRWVVQFDDPNNIPSQCTRTASMPTNRACCTEDWIRTQQYLVPTLNRLLSSGGTQQQPAQQQPSTGESGGGSVVKEVFDAISDGMSDAIHDATGGSVQKPGDQPTGETGGETVSKNGPQAEANIAPDYNWFSQNWPYLALGGIAITAVSAILYFTTRARPESRGL